MLLFPPDIVHRTCQTQSWSCRVSGITQSPSTRALADASTRRRCRTCSACDLGARDHHHHFREPSSHGTAWVTSWDVLGGYFSLLEGDTDICGKDGTEATWEVCRGAGDTLLAQGVKDPTRKGPDNLKRG